MAPIGTTVGQYAAKDLDEPPLYYTLKSESVRRLSFVSSQVHHLKSKSNEIVDISSTIFDQSNVKDV